MEQRTKNMHPTEAGLKEALFDLYQPGEQWRFHSLWETILRRGATTAKVIPETLRQVI